MQRKSREEIAEQHEWFSVTLRSIGDAVIVTDRNGLIKFMNAEAERLSGWTEVEAEGRALRTVFRIISEESRNTVDDPVEKVFRENRVVGLANHTLLLSKDGREWPIEDSPAPVCNAKKDMLGVVLVFHDATEARRGHRALKAQAEELERKVLERTITLQRTVTDLESFSYTVSHDLRSPLRAMLGYQRNYAQLEDISSHEFDKTMKTNIYAMFYLCQAAVPHLKKGGSIINTSSIQSDSPTPGLLAYATTKGAISNFTAGLAGLLGKRGIRVNSVAPGPIWTPLIPSTLPRKKAKNFGKQTPLGRAGQPAELAPVYVLLASDEGSYMTGAIVPVTGGEPIL